MTANISAHTQPDRSIHPDVRELPDMALPMPQKRTLHNGILLTTLDQGAQPVTRLTLQWNRGSADVTDPAALSLLMPMLLEGTGAMQGSEIAETLEYNGAWKAIETAAHHISLSVYLLNRSAQEILGLVRQIVTDSVFPESTLAALCERQAAQADLRQQKVDVLSRQEALRMAYGENHPMSRVISPDELRAVTPQRVRSLYERILRGCPPSVYLAGQITPAIEQAVTETLGSIKFTSAGLTSRTTIPATPLPADSVRWTLRPESLQTAVTVMLPIAGMSHAHPDYELLRVAVTALGGYFGSRLMSNIREEKGYTYGITAYLSSTEEGAFVTISSQTDNRHVDNLLRETDNEIRRLVAEPPSEEEMTVVRRTMTSNLANILDSPFSVIDYHRQVEELGFDGTRFSSQLEAITSATPEEIRRVAALYLLDAPRLTSLAGCQP